jgi:hypothetical protein
MRIIDRKRAPVVQEEPRAHWPEKAEREATLARAREALAKRAVVAASPRIESLSHTRVSASASRGTGSFTARYTASPRISINAARSLSAALQRQHEAEALLAELGVPREGSQRFETVETPDSIYERYPGLTRDETIEGRAREAEADRAFCDTGIERSRSRGI